MNEMAPLEATYTSKGLAAIATVVRWVPCSAATSLRDLVDQRRISKGKVRGYDLGNRSLPAWFTAAVSTQTPLFR